MGCQALQVEVYPWGRLIFQPDVKVKGEVRVALSQSLNRQSFTHECVCVTHSQAPCKGEKVHPSLSFPLSVIFSLSICLLFLIPLSQNFSSPRSFHLSPSLSFSLSLLHLSSLPSSFTFSLSLQQNEKLLRKSFHEKQATRDFIQIYFSTWPTGNLTHTMRCAPRGIKHHSSGIVSVWKGGQGPGAGDAPRLWLSSHTRATLNTPTIGTRNYNTPCALKSKYGKR